MAAFNLILTLRHPDAERAFWTSQKDNLCIIDQLAFPISCVNGLLLLWLITPGFHSFGEWQPYVKYVYVPIFVLCFFLNSAMLYSVRQDRDKYYRRRNSYIIAHRLLRSVLFYTIFTFHDDLRSPQGPMMALTWMPDRPLAIYSLIRMLVGRTGAFMSFLFTFNYPTSFILQLPLHVASLPGLHASAQSTWALLQSSPGMLEQACSLYGRYEYLLPASDHFLKPDLVRASCSPFAAGVLTYTVRLLPWLGVRVRVMRYACFYWAACLKHNYCGSKYTSA